jgi:CDP-6-deoxy-D-xylo-4-hexulose-3-dehydrase|tara:strand:- start:308 stop:1492 length:1185 start_codon:yes stop_codon:yes gene_type:complete
MINLVKDTINKEDIDKLISWLKTYPRLTKGKLTIDLENKWSNWLGVNHSVFCNSGSSANLLMLWALIESNRISRNSKIVIPAVSWATDLAPVIQLGMTPLICDINLKNLSVDLSYLEKIFQESQPEVLLLVSVLGLVPNMDQIVKLCKKYNVILLEDVCESMGSSYQNKKLGTYGLMSSFSTYFGHHISTIEGGFVSTNDEELFEILKSIRSHGWDRDSSTKFSKNLKEKWNTSEFNTLYTFYYSGFNLRSTDLQAFIGLNQIDKLDKFCLRRNENYHLYQKELESINLNINSCGNFVSSMAYPIIHKNRDSMVEELQKSNIEVRPMICGSMGTQPFYRKEYGSLKLPNADIIDKYGFYVPNHPLLSKQDILKITNIIKIKSSENFIDPYLQTK